MNLYSVSYKLIKKQEELTKEEKETLESNTTLLTHVTANDFGEASTKAAATEVPNLIVVNNVQLVTEGARIG